MNQGKGPWRGESRDKDHKKASLQGAIEDAWANAKKDHASGAFVVDSIEIEADNPIHAYIVVIKPAG
jgi:hypothetical protein